MVSRFDRIVIGVPDLPAAIGEYRLLLGVPPAEPGERQYAVPGARFVLPNTVIELVQSPYQNPRIRGIVFGDPGSGNADMPLANPRGLDIQLCDGSGTDGLRTHVGPSGESTLRVDHIVLRTADAASCIELFGERLGIRLALDKTVPQWGGRMLFFRAGKVTLEVIESQQEKPEADYFWGIAYQCQDLSGTIEALVKRGISLSEIRAGRKPGSQVATVKSHCLGIPTLLLQLH